MSETKSEQSACDGIKPTSTKGDKEEEEMLLEKHASVATSITTTAIVSPTSPLVSPKKMPQNCESAIRFRKAYKHYGRRASRRVPVLVGLGMTIPRGAIYGLLGPSGCGKTTLLQCIVGKQVKNPHLLIIAVLTIILI